MVGVAGRDESKASWSGLWLSKKDKLRLDAGHLQGFASTLLHMPRVQPFHLLWDEQSQKALVKKRFHSGISARLSEVWVGHI